MDEIPEDIEMVPPMELETANINTFNVSSTLPEPQMEGHNHSDNDMSNIKFSDDYLNCIAEKIATMVVEKIEVKIAIARDGGFPSDNF